MRTISDQKGDGPKEPPSARAILADLIERLRWLAAEDLAAGATPGQESITYSDLEIDIKRAKIALAMTEPAAAPATIAVTCDAKHAEHIQRHTTVTLEPVSLTDAPLTIKPGDTFTTPSGSSVGYWKVVGTAAPPFGTCGYHSKGLRHQQTEYCREFTPEEQFEDAAPPQGERLVVTLEREDDEVQIVKAIPTGRLKLNWVLCYEREFWRVIDIGPLPPAPQEQK